MATVTVHALSAGHIGLHDHLFVEPNDPSAIRQAPSLCFLIQHHAPGADKPTRLLFDLGLRRDLKLYPAALENHVKSVGLESAQPDVVESLALGGLKPTDIDYAFLSHVHYDHIGYPKDFLGGKTKFVIGPGARDVLSGKVKFPLPHSVFEPDLLSPDQSIELPPVERTWDYRPDPKLQHSLLNLSTWRPLPPFPAALDLFGDSTVYILNAPGHLPGHINMLCRLSPTPESLALWADSKLPTMPRYALLAGDSAHDRRLFEGTHKIATWHDQASGQTCYVHMDKAEAEKTVERIRQVIENERGMELILDEDDPVAAGHLSFSSMSSPSSNSKGGNGIGKFMINNDTYVEIQKGWFGDPKAQEPGRMDPERSAADQHQHQHEQRRHSNGEKRQVKIPVAIELVFAHDDVWEKDAKQRGRFWPGQL